MLKTIPQRWALQARGQLQGCKSQPAPLSCVPPGAPRNIAQSHVRSFHQHDGDHSAAAPQQRALVFVTGATRGLGGAIARQLLYSDYPKRYTDMCLVLVASPSPRLEHAARRLQVAALAAGLSCRVHALASQQAAVVHGANTTGRQTPPSLVITYSGLDLANLAQLEEGVARLLAPSSMGGVLPAPLATYQDVLLVHNAGKCVASSACFMMPCT